MSELLSSKVVVEEGEPKVRGIPSAPTSPAGAVGVCERGPIGKAVRCGSFPEFQDRFGRFTRESDVALAAMGFFENGGSELWVVRTAHYRDPSDAASCTASTGSCVLRAQVPGAAPAVVVAGAPPPWSLRDGEQIVFAVAGGGDQALAFRGTAALLTATAPGPYVLADGQTVGLRIDGGAVQELRVAARAFSNVAAATDAEVIAALNPQLRGGAFSVDGGRLRVASATRGRGSRVELMGGSALALLHLAPAIAEGSGNVQNLGAVTLAEIRALLAEVRTLTVVEVP